MRDAVRELGLRMRTGLHHGEVETRGGDVAGLAVHAAARVMALAGADQIYVTDVVAGELGGGVPLREVGTRALCGVPGEWQMFEVGEAAASSPPVEHESTSSRVHNRP